MVAVSKLAPRWAQRGSEAESGNTVSRLATGLDSSIAFNVGSGN